MNRYDITLKDILQRQLRGGVFADWMGFTVTEWLKDELPEVRMRHVDLLGRTSAGVLVHIELQSANEAEMAIRMAEYALGILRRYKEYPEQIVVYLGMNRMNMPDTLDVGRMRFGYRLVDIRDLDPEVLLASQNLEDNVLAILAGAETNRESVRAILARLEHASPTDRRRATQELAILAGLRRIRDIMEEETQTMPVADIMDNDFVEAIVRRANKKMIEEAAREAAKEAAEKAAKEASTIASADTARQIVVDLLQSRFGNPSSDVLIRVNAMSVAELRGLATRILTVESPEALFN